MAILAETLTTYDRISAATSLPWQNFNVGPWINNQKGELKNAAILPRKKGLYIHYFLRAGQWVPFYAGMTRAKNGLYHRIYSEYNKKQAAVAKSGPYEACLYLDYNGMGGIPIGILFHDMSDRPDREIEQAEKDLLKALDFCANTQNNGSRRLGDLLQVILDLDKTAKPYLNTMECAETIKEEDEEEQEEVEEEAEEEPVELKKEVPAELKKEPPVVSPDLCRSMIPSYAEVIHPDLFRKLQQKAMETYHMLLYQSCKEMLSDRENQRILEEAQS